MEKITMTFDNREGRTTTLTLTPLTGRENEFALLGHGADGPIAWSDRGWFSIYRPTNTLGVWKCVFDMEDAGSTEFALCTGGEAVPLRAAMVRYAKELGYS